ncbi:MAG: TonB-dependent receptor [Pseudomonadales bacterium]
MAIRYKIVGVVSLAATLLITSQPALSAEQQQRRQIEEVIVTAERRQSTVQDTSISMSAFDSNFMENYNIRNPEDLQNYMPSTVIQTYDAAIRGVGRTFRTLGGDPGIATYFNDVYSEDFAIAATEGGLQDLERVEVLRGPQGTLYGRNAVGGAVNFITKRPTEQFELDVEASAGNFGLFEHSAIISGPLIDNVLRGRLSSYTRDRDGFINDTSPTGKDIASQGDENFALALEWTPTDSLTFYLRGNLRNSNQEFNGGAGSSALHAGDLGPNGYQDGFRNTEDFAFGFREITRGNFDPSQPDFHNPGAQVFEFAHPQTGAIVEAQRARPGIDSVAALDEPDGAGGFIRGNATSAFVLPNYAFGHPASRTHAYDRENLEGDDLKTDTNGNVFESFDHSAVQFHIDYEHAAFSFKYIFGYTDFDYRRNTDDDYTGSERFGSDEFFVQQENENWQHEVRFTFDTGPVTTTAGVFVYQSTVNQRLDLYDQIDTQGRLQDTASYDGFGLGSDLANAQMFGTVLGVLDSLPASVGGLPDDTIVINRPMNQIREAEFLHEAGEVALSPATGAATVLAPWYGDSPPPGQPASSLRGGAHHTLGTYFAWDNDIQTDAVAYYFQSEWQINDKWSLTGGLRYSKDEKEAIERLIGQQENTALTPLALFDVFNLFGGGANAPLPGTANAFATNPVGAGFGCGFADGNPATNNMLCLFNVVNGAINPLSPIQAPGDPGTNPGDEPVRLTGVPIAFNIYRPLETEDSAVTWRLNLDYKPTVNSLVYGSVTTGWKAGGFNLGFFSVNNQVYDEETIISYEVGYKTQLLDNSLQFNTALYYYEQEDRQTGTRQVSGLGTSTDIANWPETAAIGWEGDFTWLATESLTIGGNWSYTKSEFDSNFTVVDTLNPEHPTTLFRADELSVTGGDGLQQPKIPVWKATGWAQYTWNMAYGSIDFFTSVAYTDEWWIEPPFERDIDRAPEFVRWDARASWKSPTRRWEVSVFVNNITDEVGIRDIERQTEDMNFQRTITTTEPRLYGIGVRYHISPGDSF